MASRLQKPTKSLLKKHKWKQKHKKSTDCWTKIFQQWAKTRGKNEQLDSYEVLEINEALDNFALDVINK